MDSNNRLGKQVRAELKKRRYVILTSLLLSLLYIAANLLFSDTGWLRYKKLLGRQAELRQEVRRMGEENTRLRASIKSYKENDFLMEKYSREDFGLSRPDEYIFLYDR
ncbi:MAG: septum formation initiator family protein [Thermodesulfovibrionales bacterium]|nr:septum formation initiator family protein [Thermodesulfovibrionales bacterium]